MNDSRRPEPTRPSRPGGERTDRLQQPYPPYNDPAYAGQPPYAPPYYQGHPGQGADPTDINPTEKLPRYWAHGVPPHQATQEPLSASGRPKSPRWLWIAAGAAVLLVVALVIALLLANGSAKKQTTVAPLPGAPGKSATSSAAPPATTSAPGGATASPSTETSSPADADTVVYTVNGEGRAISITFVDTGGMMQTEFNVALPWSKEVSLSKSSDHRANVTIVNIGNNVTCTVTVGGVQVRQQTGVGLTVCNAPL